MGILVRGSFVLRMALLTEFSEGVFIDLSHGYENGIKMRGILKRNGMMSTPDRDRAESQRPRYIEKKK
jgi:hypothetical protein